MEEKEYLQTLGEQILNPHARTHVLEEIQEHIDEQMQDYIDTGMSPDAAEKEAVRQMGDPVAAGTELNRSIVPGFRVFCSALRWLLHYPEFSCNISCMVLNHLTPPIPTPCLCSMPFSIR